MILLVAIVAAIVLTMRGPRQTKAQQPRASGGTARGSGPPRQDAGARTPTRVRSPSKNRAALRDSTPTMPALSDFLVLGAILFCLSVAGIFINRKNVIILLMCIELMLLAVNMNFIAFSHFLGNMAGQVFVFFILTVAAAESAIGLAILVVLFRNRNTINVDDLNRLNG